MKAPPLKAPRVQPPCRGRSLEAGRPDCGASGGEKPWQRDPSASGNSRSSGSWQSETGQAEGQRMRSTSALGAAYRAKRTERLSACCGSQHSLVVSDRIAIVRSPTARAVFFCVYGRGEALEALGQLQLRTVYPEEIIQEFLSVLTIQFRFVVKTRKGEQTRGGREACSSRAGGKSSIPSIISSLRFCFDRVRRSK